MCSAGILPADRHPGEWTPPSRLAARPVDVPSGTIPALAGVTAVTFRPSVEPGLHGLEQRLRHILVVKA